MKFKNKAQRAAVMAKYRITDGSFFFGGKMSRRMANIEARTLSKRHGGMHVVVIDDDKKAPYKVTDEYYKGKEERTVGKILFPVTRAKSLNEPVYNEDYEEIIKNPKVGSNERLGRITASKFKNYSNKALVNRINRRFANNQNDDDEVFELFRRSKAQGFKVKPKFDSYEIEE